MRINNNITALTAYNNLNRTDSALGKNLERLSSGLRINRAADDAAGLTISENMRAQIKGLNQAARNAQDGVSLIQTAEGGLQESQSILQRLRELSVQAANGTSTDNDRKEIQKEMNQLIEEIDKISSETKFNGKTLLNGDFKTGADLHVGSNANEVMTFEINAMGSKNLGDQSTVYKGTTAGSATADFSLANKTYTLTDTASGSTFSITLDQNYGTLIDGAGVVNQDGLDSLISDINSKFAAIGANVNVTAKAVDADSNGTNDGISLDFDRTNAFTMTDGGAAVTVNTATTGITIDTLKREPDLTTGGVLTQDSAEIAIAALDGAIQQVSSERSRLGSYQNRLEHTINNLNTHSENLTAAESRIRDLDMAKEMANFTKNNILMQAGTSMLAQANSRPQSVLSLLG